MAADWGEFDVALKADPSRDKGRASLASPPTPPRRRTRGQKGIGFRNAKGSKVQALAARNFILLGDPDSRIPVDPI
jgi:hypothetical protein